MVQYLHFGDLKNIWGGITEYISPEKIGPEKIGQKTYDRVPSNQSVPKNGPLIQWLVMRCYEYTSVKPGGNKKTLFETTHFTIYRSEKADVHKVQPNEINDWNYSIPRRSAKIPLTEKLLCLWYGSMGNSTHCLVRKGTSGPEMG